MTINLSPELIMFDLDGTLVDSVPDISWCIDETMKQIGLPARGEAVVRTWIGNGADRTIQRAIANDLHAPHDDSLFEPAMSIFFELYAENNSKRSQLYPGVREGLDYLHTLRKNRGLRMGCITNKDEKFTHPLLHDLNLWNDFEIILSGDTLDRKKPDPLPLLHGAKELACDVSKSIMVGDSQTDIKAARAAGFTIICTTYGYNHGEDIRDSKPDAVINSMIEFKTMIN